MLVTTRDGPLCAFLTRRSEDALDKKFKQTAIGHKMKVVSSSVPQNFTISSSGKQYFFKGMLTSSDAMLESQTTLETNLGSIHSNVASFMESQCCLQGETKTFVEQLFVNLTQELTKELIRRCISVKIKVNRPQMHPVWNKLVDAMKPIGNGVDFSKNMTPLHCEWFTDVICKQFRLIQFDSANVEESRQIIKEAFSPMAEVVEDIYWREVINVLGKGNHGRYMTSSEKKKAEQYIDSISSACNSLCH